MTSASTKPAKVLIIGDDTRSFLASVRSLGRQGIEVHAAPYTLGSPALASKYISKIHMLPYYLDGGAEWLKAMQHIISTEQYDMVLPCEERSLLPLFTHQKDLPSGTVLAIPDAVGLNAFFNKVHTRALAVKVKVPVAPGYEPSATDTAASISAKLTFPIIAKFKKSYSLPDLYVRTSVEILKTPDALADWVKKNAAKFGDIYFEQMFAGTGVGVSVLCYQGKVLQAFEHHRAHELAGSSYYRQSMPLELKRLQAVERMVAETAYTGLAMFEFKLHEPTGNWILLEVNARPWGSLPLPVALGVDFPYRLYRLLCLGDTAGHVSYRSQVFGRNLISDIWQVRAQAAAMRHQKIAFAKHLIGWVAGFARLLVRREHHDVLVWDDIRPGLLEMRQFVTQRSQALRAPAALTVNSQWPALLKHTRSGQPVHLLFLCQGNICRSPYAEHKARQLLGQAGLPCTVESAGMLPRNHRASPAAALAAAAQHGVDLLPHQSQHAFAPVMDRADLVIIFDSINERACLARYPSLAGRLVYLSQFKAGSIVPHEIDDPDGRDVATFVATYRQIDECLVGLVQAVNHHTASP